MLAGVALVAGGSFWAGRTVRGAGASLPRHVAEPRPTAAIQRRRLRDVLTISGTVKEPPATKITPLPAELEAGALPIVTSLPISRGESIANGSVLAEVGGMPIVALEGTVPSYRPLHQGLAGRDVAQLQVDLEQLGYVVDDAPDWFGASTALAAKAVFAQRGYTLPRVAIASRRARSTSKRGGRRRVPRTSVDIPPSAVVFITHLPVRITHVNAHVGERLSGTLLSVADGRPRVQATVEAAQLLTLSKGMPVEAPRLGDARGHIAETVSPSRANDASTVVIEFAASVRLPKVGTRLSMRIVRSSARRTGWVVPYSAIQDSGSGAAFIEVRRGKRYAHVAVRPGYSAGGYVMVRVSEDSDLHAGERVVVDATLE